MVNVKKKLSRALAAATVGISLAGGAMVASAVPAHAASSCAGAGYLCFYDYGTAQYGNVSGNNGYWGNFGWNDRADWFYNQGNSCTVRVYKDLNGGGGGYAITRGSTLRWDNIVSSNYWC